MLTLVTALAMAAPASMFTHQGRLLSSTGEPLSDPLPHGAPIWYVAVAFSDDGDAVVTGGEDGTALPAPQTRPQAGPDALRVPKGRPAGGARGH